ncbi:heterokaryon incompatibility protein-domain-containing protein [Xylaria sp. FL0064]|nr:heterokaryon incompatibility protein-domain-containing protein [Xylaria sp. FL0064]
MIPYSRDTMRRYSFWKWPELQDSKLTKTKSRRNCLTRWLTHWRSKAAPLCHKCRNRKLDLRPLLADPPDISVLPVPEDPEDEHFDELEAKYTVYIDGFLAEEAKASKLECSLCALLLASLDATCQDGWLGHMRCIVQLRPRFDRSTNVKKEGRIIHKQQIWVEFQPIEGEVLVDLVDVEEFKPTGKRRPVAPTADLKLLKWWLKNCDQKHSHPDISSTVRSRMQVILDGGIFRLINTTTGSVEVLTSLPIFVALSYVWGPNSGQTKCKPLEGGPVSDYPPTIRDSIVTAKALGYGWLWVDRLCIDQNSSSEKAKLIPYMKDIYAAAHLTIVAACGAGAEDGLFGTQGTPRKVEKPLILGPSVAVLPVSLEFEDMKSNATWSTRGWTFQEHVFSRRLLFAFDLEMIFTCGERVFRESTGRRRVIRNQGGVKRWLFHEGGICDAGKLQTIFHNNAAKIEGSFTSGSFLKALMEYSERSLSVKEDRVGAFAGVVLSAMDPMDQLSEEAFLKHGHPLTFFESLLTWGRGFVLGTIDPSKKLDVPSWSWAYTGVGVRFEVYGDTRGCYDQYHHFDYTQLPNHDVLGLPTKYHAATSLLEFPLSDELVADRSWMENLPQESESEHGGCGTSSLTLTSLLPKLHLLTLIFDARFIRYEHFDGSNTYMLAPLGSTETALDIKRSNRERRTQDDKIGDWSLQPGCEFLFPKQGDICRQQPFETFAVITGFPRIGAYDGNTWRDDVYFDLNVMLLEPTGQQDTYSRLGMNCLHCVWKESWHSEIIKKGRPRWQYIHLV